MTALFPGSPDAEHVPSCDPVSTPSGPPDTRPPGRPTNPPPPPPPPPPPFGGPWIPGPDAASGPSGSDNHPLSPGEADTPGSAAAPALAAGESAATSRRSAGASPGTHAKVEFLGEAARVGAGLPPLRNLLSGIRVMLDCAARAAGHDWDATGVEDMARRDAESCIFSAVSRIEAALYWLAQAELAVYPDTPEDSSYERLPAAPVPGVERAVRAAAADARRGDGL